MKNKSKTVYMVLLALIVWFGLVLQFYISTEKYLSEGRTLGGAIVQLLSYFTIQNNFLVALSLTLIWLLPTSSWGKFFSKTSTLTAIAFYITIVFLVYQIILRRQHTMHGLFALANEILHTVSPILFVLFWLIFVLKGNIPWIKALTWLIYPLLYLVYALVRGAFTGYYPYSFIDGNVLSYLQITINSVGLLLVFLLMGSLFIFIDRSLKKQ
jgi:hypothetical protein